ncbi:recombination protein F [Gimesia panareensis]|uniref:Recombination protein F n=1 Tax=Gimesia panareensis TaxID=2527978 RepID=A0A517Q7P1_9PLAN|nr:AAA family ATPase [Gimesia panareensis]QDT27655.1 recombination protein F [Gimesia panareensis]
MHLSTLSFTDLRQFEKGTFEFSPGFNLLVGENGAGKSTIIRGVIAAVGDTRSVSEDQKIGDEDIRLGSDHAIVEAVVRFSDSSIDYFRFEKPLWGRIKRSPRGSTRPLVLSYASNEAVCRSMRVKQIKRLREDKHDHLRQEQEFLYYGSGRKFPDNHPGLNGKRFGNSQQVLEFVGKMLSNFSPDFEDFHWRFEPYACTLIPQRVAEKGIPVDTKLKKQIEAASLRFFQEGHLRSKNRFPDWPDQSEVVLGLESESSIDKEMDMLLRAGWEVMDLPSEALRLFRNSLLKVKLTPRIMIMRPIGPLSLGQLSDGEQRLFSLFVDIARNLSLQNEPDGNIGSGKAIILIDEIDVHLHPKWQRQIVPLLEDLFPNCQFIATTHSPFVIQSVRSDSNLVLLDGQPLAQLGNTGIEEISQVVMEVSRPDVSERYAKEVELSKSFLQLLDEAEKAPKEKLEEYIDRLRKKLEHAQNPAMQAFLELQQASRLEG